MHRKITLALVAIVGLVAGSARADDKAKAVVEKAVEAIGGKDNLKKFVGGKYKSKGTIQVMGMEVAVSSETTFLLPDKEKNEMAMNINGMEIGIVQLINGDKVKMTAMGQAIPLTDAQLDEMKQSVYLQKVYNVAPLLEKEFELKIVNDSAKVGDKEAVVVSAKSEKLKEVRIFFDKKTHLMLKLERRGSDPSGQEGEQEILFDDYKEKDGIKRAMKMEMKQDGKEFMKMELSDFENLKEVSKSDFDISD